MCHANSTSWFFNYKLRDTAWITPHTLSGTRCAERVNAKASQQSPNTKSTLSLCTSTLSTSTPLNPRQYSRYYRSGHNPHMARLALYSSSESQGATEQQQKQRALPRTHTRQALPPAREGAGRAPARAQPRPYLCPGARHAPRHRRPQPRTRARPGTCPLPLARTPRRSPLQTGELGLFLSGELLPGSGDCRRWWCRTLPSGSGGTGEEQGEGPLPGGGGGRWWCRGGLPRAPPWPRVGLPRDEAAPPPLPAPPGGAVAGPPRPPLPGGAARGSPAAGPPPLLVGLPCCCCCCCCLSWKGTVARMGWRRLLAPAAPPPAAAAPPPPAREVAGVGEPPRLTRWWDIVRPEPGLAEGGLRRGRDGRVRGTGGTSRGPTPQVVAAAAPAPSWFPSRSRPLRAAAPAASVRLINNSAPAARPAHRALPLGAAPLRSRSYGASIGCGARAWVAELARGHGGGAGRGQRLKGRTRAASGPRSAPRTCGRAAPAGTGRAPDSPSGRAATATGRAARWRRLPRLSVLFWGTIIPTPSFLARGALQEGTGLHCGLSNRFATSSV